MSHPVRLVCAVLVGLAAVVGVPGAVNARPPTATASDPLAGVGQRYWGGEFQGIGVLTDLPSGRIQVYARWTEVGRYVHFGLGARDGRGACVPTLWVRVDQEHATGATVSDAAGAPVEVLQRFAPDTAADDWMHAARLAIDPAGLAAGCVTAFGTQGPKPTSPQVGRRRTADLRPMTDLGHHPTHLSFPGVFTWDEDAQVQYHVDAGPGGAWEALLVPPTTATIQVVLPPESGLATTAPVEPVEQDLWVDPVLDGALTVRPTSPYGAHPQLDVLADGLLLGSDHGVSFHPNVARVSMPVPDWSASLAGQVLWARDPDKWHQPYHLVLTFLDDGWVYLTDQAADPVPATCDAVDDSLHKGCHRYYYDGGTGLQVDDMRLEPTTDPAGWALLWTDDPVRAGSSTAPVPADTRLAYHGTGASFGCTPLPRFAARGCAVSDVDLRLHRDGTYRFTKVSSIDGITKQHHGSYRFTGTSLVLDPAKFPPVTLDGVIGYWQGDTLLDIDWAVAGVYGVQP